jgi:hypothetical protein
VPRLDLTGQLVSDGDEQPVSKHTLSKEAKARQALRISKLTAEGYLVHRGLCGLTVFNFAGAWQK